MSNAKVVAKGEYLFKEGDKVTTVYLIQSGSIQLCIQRPKKNIELAILGNGQILGEQSYIGSPFPFSAIATSETKVVEIPSELFKQQIDSASQVIKVAFKSLVERMKTTTNELRSLKSEKDATPCPEDQVARVFATVFHTVRYKGEKDSKNPNQYLIEWSFFRQYSQRIFGDSLKRLEQVTQILVKLGYAKYIMGKLPEDPEGPDQILQLQINDLAMIESFFEFYQYYYFKGGKTDLLKSDESATNFLNHFNKLSEGLQPDRNGAVTIEYSKVIEYFKNEVSINLNNDHFSRLESKGLFVKRQPKSDGQVWLSWDIKEFQTTAKIWRLLREIEKWNDKGFIDMTEDDLKTKKKASGPSCPSCAVTVAAEAKFCQECGHKLQAAA